MKRLMPCAAILALLTQPVAASDWRSVYTDIDFEACTMIYSYEVGADFACPGHKGYPLLISESDLRFAVSYGFNAKEEAAWRQTFPQFNNLGARIEWLLEDDPELGEIPVGTILRFFLAAPEYEDPDKQVLVVTKIEPGNTCQVAHIDALANQNANQIARDAARDLIPDFKCSGAEPKRIGNWSIEF